MAKYICFKNNSISVLTVKVETDTVFPAFFALIKDAQFFVDRIEHIPGLAEALTAAFMKFFNGNKECFDEQKVLDWIKNWDHNLLPDSAISYNEIQELMKMESNSSEE